MHKKFSSSTFPVYVLFHSQVFGVCVTRMSFLTLGYRCCLKKLCKKSHGRIWPYSCLRLFATTTERPDKEVYDIVVNGGGLVGLSFMASLAAQSVFQDKKILLLEQLPPKTVTNKKASITNRIISNRVSSITTASQRFLDEIGIWDKMSPSVKKVMKMHVWSDCFDRGITFTPRYPGLSDISRRSQFADEVVCFFVENHVLLNALEEIVPSKNIRYASSITDVKPAGQDLDLILEDGTRIRSHLLIGSDGFNSIVRKKSTLRYFEEPLGESAIVGTVKMEVNQDTEDNSITFQRFLPEDGTVIGLLPITSTHSSFVISTSKAKAHLMMSLDDQEFVEAMNAILSCESPVSRRYPKVLKSLVEQVDNILSKVLPSPESGLTTLPEVQSLVPNSRASFPLFFGTTAPSLIGSPIGSKNNKIVVIGDSCHRIPPLAGQGLNLGIGDAVQLSECLREGLERGDDIFQDSQSLESCLQAFEMKRQAKLLPMMAAVASMQTVFGFTPSSLISSFNHLSLLKNEVVKFANTR